ncbi:hypothetical protein [Haloarcula brevis]|uniref:hypothetical protein n=1 Tax=Haloarcula brevis TaxID=3111453 RepID=UPI00300F3082
MAFDKGEASGNSNHDGDPPADNIIVGSDNPQKRSEIISNEFGMFGGAQSNARPWFMELFASGVNNNDLIDTFPKGAFRRSNINSFISKGMIYEKETDEGDKQYGLTELGKEFEEGFRTLARAAQYRVPVGRLLRGFPDQTRHIPDDPANPELRSQWLPPFDAFSFEAVNIPNDDWFEDGSAPTTIQWEEDPEAETIPRQKCRRCCSNATKIKIFTPWLVPSLPVLENYTQTDTEVQMILGPHGLNNSGDANTLDELIDLNDPTDDIRIRGLELRLPYLLGVFEYDTTEESTVFLWGKGAKSDSYHVTMKSTHPDILDWANELFDTVAQYDRSLRKIDRNG